MRSALNARSSFTSQKVANQGLRRTWWFACKDETINPVHPTRLPLLFAPDVKLKLSDGFHYLPNCNKQKSTGGDGTPAVNCATDFGSSSSDGSDSSSNGFGDLGFSSDSDDGDSGSSCGGSGCGGGGGD